ncbi:MAG: hypothetical protein KC619_17300 [Myxococcales bacterium]|nr:hypothetical protein [Myxococcales bacterium]
MRFFIPASLLLVLAACGSEGDSFNRTAATYECTIADECGIGIIEGTLQSCITERTNLWVYYYERCDYDPAMGTAYLDTSQQILDTCTAAELPYAEQIYTHCDFSRE